MSHKQSFFYILDILDKHKIEYATFYGTLLGAIRDNGFLPTDTKDTDIVVLNKHYKKVKQILDKEMLNKKIRYLSIWRKEISVLHGSYKIDIFFLEKNEDKANVYLYKKNSIDEKWTVEWRIKFPFGLIFPTKQIDFLGRKIKIPKYSKEILKYLYGKSWKIPKPKWKHESDSLIIDKNYRQIAIIIPSFLRKQKTIKEVKSILKLLHPERYRLYIGNQAGEDIRKDYFFKKLEKQGHKVFNLPYNCGLSYARNYLIKQTVEPFILLIDNDFKFIKETNLDKFIQILLEDNQIGMVGGKLSERENYTYKLFLNKKHHKLCYVKYPEQWKETTKTYIQKSNKYIYTDLILNFFLARREIFDDIQWDNDLKLVEHTDFFYRLKNTNWRVAFTPEVQIKHQSEKSDEEYTQFRGEINKQPSLKLFLDKYGLSSKHDLIKISKEEYKELKKNNFKIIKKVINTPIYNTIHLTKNISSKKMIHKLSDNEMFFIVLKETCLDSVRFNKLILKPNELHLTTLNRECYFKLFSFLKSEGFKRTKQPIPNQLTINLYNIWQTGVKKMPLYNRIIKVPFPVVQYLEKLYGGNWKNYGIK